MKYWFSILLCVKFMLLLSQNGQGYYHDYNNSFYVFDKGIERQAEVNRVTDIYSGNDYVAYTDSKLSFVYYYNGYQKVLEENFPNKVVATAPALIYKMQERLMICEKGETKQLARRADVFFASDSIVIWQALPSLDYMAYVNGETKTIIKATNSSVINDYKINNNIMAFNDLNNDLKVYFNGEIYTSNNNRITNYECGHNIVAFIDEYKSTFNVFYKGVFKIISKEIIKEYLVINDMVAYVDAKDNFYIFYDGAITKIDSRSPDFFSGKGNILYYSYNSELKIIYEGEIYPLPLVNPKSLILGQNGMLFYININQPQYFYKGKVYDNFYVQRPYTMELKLDLPIFKYNNTIGFWYNAKIHEYPTRSN